MLIWQPLINWLITYQKYQKNLQKNTETKSFKKIGSFGSIFDLGNLKMKNPVIV